MSEKIFLQCQKKTRIILYIPSRTRALKGWPDLILKPYIKGEFTGIFSKHRPSGPMLSISRNVRLCVRLSVCLSVRSLLRYCLTVFLPPLPKVGCQICFRDSESMGKSNGKKWSNIWTFLFGIGLKSPRKKKVFFCADFALQNMVETTHTDGLETSGRRAYRYFWHISRRFWVFAFLIIFSVFQKIRVLRCSWSTRKSRFPMG